MAKAKKSVKRKNQDALDDLLDPPIAFNPAFLRITGSPQAAIFLSQSWYWTKINLRNGGDGWWYNSQVEIQEQTGLTRSNQETARRVLGNLGIQDEKLKGVPATLHFRVDKMKVYELLGFQFAESPQTEGVQFAESPQTGLQGQEQTGLQDDGKLDSGDSAIFNKKLKTPPKTPLDSTKKDLRSEIYVRDLSITHIQEALKPYAKNQLEEKNTMDKIRRALESDGVSLKIDSNVYSWVGLNGHAEDFQDRYAVIINKHTSIQYDYEMEFCE
jgi:hypothetical protein